MSCMPVQMSAREDGLRSENQELLVSLKDVNRQLEVLRIEEELADNKPQQQ